jgi:imidazolonepropionase-like amidohydrolase
LALGLPADSVAKIAAVRSAGLQALQTCRRAGVHIGFGTDLLGASQRLQCDEFRIRAEVQPPIEVIRSATVVAAQVLQMEDRLGRLVPGAYADLLVVDGDPLADLSCFWSDGGQGSRLAVVMKEGRIFHESLGR